MSLGFTAPVPSCYDPAEVESELFFARSGRNRRILAAARNSLSREGKP